MRHQGHIARHGKHLVGTVTTPNSDGYGIGISLATHISNGKRNMENYNEQLEQWKGLVANLDATCKVLEKLMQSFERMADGIEKEFISKKEEYDCETNRES